VESVKALLNTNFSKSTLGLDKSEQKFYNLAAAKVVGILIYPAKVFGFMPSPDPVLEEKRGTGRGDPYHPCSKGRWSPKKPSPLRS